MKKVAELGDWLKLHLAWLSLKELDALERFFGSLGEALEAGEQDWLQVEGFDKARVQRFFGVEQELIDKALEWGVGVNQQIISLDDEHYPKLLKQIADPPILLYVRGNPALLSEAQLAVVGSRNASRAGLQIAENFGAHLSKMGLCITSGMALGIDTHAHLGGLKGQGSTVAVIGTGIDRVYPASNKNLAHQIAEQGAIVSEFPLETPPLSRNFPLRNRIISGMATGCLVVEAALKSGSLITARQAMEQGREVFAIPGSINNSLAKGCHQLIKQGAKLVETSDDILEELAPLIEFSWEETLDPPTHTSKNSGKTSAKHPILEVMEYEPISLDELIVLTKMAASDIQAQMMFLELEGKVNSLPAGRWIKVS